MARPLLLVTGVLFLLATAGCIDYAEVLEIRPDGSGTLTIVQTVDRLSYEQVIALLQSMRSGDSQAELPAFDEATIRSKLEGREGLVLRSVAVEDFEEGGVKKRKLTTILDFTSPEKLVVGDLALAIQPFELERREEDGRTVYSFARKVGMDPAQLQALLAKKKKDGEDEKPAVDEAQIAGFRSLFEPLLAGKKATFTLRMPGTITSTNIEEGKGTTSGGEATWDFPISELAAGSRELTAESNEVATGGE
ncbi:MAG: hypothetical protein HY720_12505 [Planctomycetes bacterium]|nr:hypothetical protein [Planctomycetota bacterium]